MIETKGLSCLFFLEIQPLEKTVAYKALLIKQNKCTGLLELVYKWGGKVQSGGGKKKEFEAKTSILKEFW